MTGLRTLIGKLLFQWPQVWIYRFCDRIYVPLDRSHIRRSRNIGLIPNENFRRGGKYSYAEWGHVIGLFQSLICQYLPRRASDHQILDVGCGTGILAIAAEPYVQQEGQYTGIDISQADIAFCRSHYSSSHFRFEHLEIRNPEYAPDREQSHLSWPQRDESFDMVTALSVWTHLCESDASFYLAEVRRVLKPGGKAIITFFVLDDDYENMIAEESEGEAKFHRTPKGTWVFDQASYESKDFRHPVWAEIPESAIAINQSGLNRILEETGLQIVQHHSGTWKEVPGLYFQDVLVLEKSTPSLT